MRGHATLRPCEIKLNRSETDIFADLEALCASPGFIHTIAYLSARDTMFHFEGEATPDDLATMHAAGRLIRNEVNALIGLLVKQEIDYSAPDAGTFERHVSQSESLLEEMHHAMAAPAGMSPLAGIADSQKATFASGFMMREAIFYGGESAYMFQYRDFAAQRYGRDDPWIISHKGFSMGDAAAMVKAIAKIHNEKSTVAFHSFGDKPSWEQPHLPSHEFTAAEVAERSGMPVDYVEFALASFFYPEGERNAGFTAMDARNMAAILPLIRRGDRYILFNTFDLAEVLYQAPYFWIQADTQYYQDFGKDNRGKFTEDFAESRLAAIFGRPNVKTNVKIFRGKTEVGEIDALVVFGDIAIIVQAKSKQLTAMARQGNEAKLKSDFGFAIQKASDQAYSCGPMLLDPSLSLQTVDGTPIATPTGIKRIFPICLIADHYPALAFQAGQFLKFDATELMAPPFVMDVFLLDAMAEMLDTPLYFLSYLDRRTTYHEAVMSSHELNILGYHLGHNLWMDGSFNMLHLDDDVGTSLELSMLVRRENLPGPWTPPGILTRIANLRMGKIVKEIEREPNAGLRALGFLILSLGEDSLVGLSDIIDELMRRAVADGNAHNASAELGGAKHGLTVHINSDPLETAKTNLMGYCSMRKYAQRSASWFGIVLDPRTGAIRFGVHASFPWVHDPDMDTATKNMMKSAPAQQVWTPKALKAGKVGRNDPCPCGSGAKSKECCGA